MHPLAPLVLRDEVLHRVESEVIAEVQNCLDIKMSLDGECPAENFPARAVDSTCIAADGPILRIAPNGRLHIFDELFLIEIRHVFSPF